MNVSAPPRPLIAPSIIYRPDFICWPSAEAHRGPLAVRSLRRRESRFPVPILHRLPHRVPSALAQPGAPPGALAPRSRGATRDAVRFRRRDRSRMGCAARRTSDDDLPPAAPIAESAEATSEAEERLPDFSEMDVAPVEEKASLPAPEPFRPEPIPTPEPPLPLPSPPTPQPEPEPEPEPEEDRLVAARKAELETIQQALEEERAGMEAWNRSQLEEFLTKEVALAERETAIVTKAQEVATRDRAVTDRLL